MRELKKSVFFLLLFIVLCPFRVRADDKTDIFVLESQAILPYSLEMLEEEAFQGTAIETLIFQENVYSVGERAFEDTTNLKAVYIPPATTQIAQDAFSEEGTLTIYGVRGSYAEKWAKQHHIPFKKADIWRLIVSDGNVLHSDVILQLLFHLMVVSEEIIRVVVRFWRRKVSMRPQDRPELNSIHYRFP